MDSPVQTWDPVVIFSSFHLADIVAAKMELESAGIRFRASNESFSGLYPGCDGMATIDVMVDRSDADRARSLLKHLNEGLQGNHASSPTSTDV